MNFPHEISIKQEQDDFGVQNNDDFMKPHFDVNVKVEDTMSVDWCLQNEELITDLEGYQIYNVKQEYVYYACLICYKEFLDSFSLYHHNLTHLRVVLDQQNLYQCDHCQCYHTRKKDLARHIHSKHLVKNELMLTSNSFKFCYICNTNLKVKDWQSHMKQQHGIDKLKCSTCNVTFKCVEYYRRHLRHTHEKIRPSWRFHSVFEQEFQCHLCSALFNNRNSRTTHIRNCHSLAHECPVCKSMLKSKSYLLTHMKRVHYNDGKLHQCDVCKKKFRSPRYLTIHKKNAHQIKPKGRVKNEM